MNLLLMNDDLRGTHFIKSSRTCCVCISDARYHLISHSVQLDPCEAMAISIGYQTRADPMRLPREVFQLFVAQATPRLHMA